MALSLLNRLRITVCASSVDNFVFKLCYRWTSLLLVAFSAVITCRLLFGSSFSCISNAPDVPSHYLHTKCYEDTVYTQPAKLIVRESEAPGMEPHAEKFRRYQSYYPWVNLLLLVQAFNFYLPHLLWKSYESGYVRKLTAGVQNFFDKEEKRGLELCYLAKYVLVSQGKHKVYTKLYIFFEAQNYAIALAQTLWLTYFFGVTGVPHFLPFSLETWSDYRNFYFPKTGICEFTKFTGTGEFQTVLAFCSIPLNGLYMKMFLFLHAWYIGLTILCGVVLIYRIALLVPSFRTFVAKLSSPLAERSVLKSLCHRLSYSDWFFLTHVQKTMTDVDFAQMLDKIAIVSQGRDPLKDEDVRSFCEEGQKDLNSSSTISPL